MNMEVCGHSCREVHIDATGNCWERSGVQWCFVRVSEDHATNNTSQQDFGTRKVYCVSNVTFHAESKYAIKIFTSPPVFVQWPF